MIFFVLPIFDGVIMDGHPIFQLWWMPTCQNIGCLSIMTPSKMGKTKKSHLLFSNFHAKDVCLLRDTTIRIKSLNLLIVNVSDYLHLLILTTTIDIFNNLVIMFLG